MSPTSYRPGRFTIEGLDGVFEGYTSGRLWNGWATPVFELDAALRIADAFRVQVSPDGPYLADYDADGDTFVFQDPYDDEPVTYASMSLLVDGGPVTVYPLGTDVWTWQERDRPRIELPAPRPITLRLVYEAGPDPLTGDLLPREEETVTVEAPTPEIAARCTMRHARIDARGRLVRHYTSEGHQIYGA